MQLHIFTFPHIFPPMFSSLCLPKSVERTSVLGVFSSSTPPPASGDDGVGVRFTLFFILHSPFLCPFSFFHHLYGPSPWTPPTSFRGHPCHHPHHPKLLARTLVISGVR